jgi:hypothetical protein
VREIWALASLDRLTRVLHSLGLEKVDLAYRSDKTTVIIEARDLDTDERDRTTVNIRAPSDSAGRRTSLAGAVAECFPDAQLRSFADGAATFLDRQHLIVACFAKPDGQVVGREQERSPASQEALFAA